MTQNRKEEEIEVIDEDAENFARKTYREVKIWDWLARILPLTALTCLAVAYFFKWSTAIELVLDITVVLFFLTCFVWWYWAIYKIAVAVKYIRLSQEKFSEIKEDLNDFKKSVRRFGRQDVDKSK